MNKPQNHPLTTRRLTTISAWVHRDWSHFSTFTSVPSRRWRLADVPPFPTCSHPYMALQDLLSPFLHSFTTLTLCSPKVIVHFQKKSLYQFCTNFPIPSALMKPGFPQWMGLPLLTSWIMADVFPTTVRTLGLQAESCPPEPSLPLPGYSPSQLSYSVLRLCHSEPWIITGIFWPQGDVFSFRENSDSLLITFSNCTPISVLGNSSIYAGHLCNT